MLKLLIGLLCGVSLFAADIEISSYDNVKKLTMSKSIKAYVYVEAQTSVPFEEFSWAEVNQQIKKQPGFISKTWLSGVDNNSIGGFYAFDSIENAKKYATGFMAERAKKLNSGLTTRIFDAERVEKASREMNSPFYN